MAHARSWLLNRTQALEGKPCLGQNANIQDAIATCKSMTAMLRGTSAIVARRDTASAQDRLARQRISAQFAGRDLRSIAFTMGKLTLNLTNACPQRILAILKIDLIRVLHFRTL
ncbi:MAG: hypothetical protein ACRCYP_01130 [Alphaproteobacteria bacterium]